MISSTLDAAAATPTPDAALSALALLAPTSAFSLPATSGSASPFYPALHTSSKRSFAPLKAPNPLKATSPLQTPPIKSTSPFQPPNKSPRLTSENSFSALQLAKSPERPDADGEGKSDSGSDKATQTTDNDCNTNDQTNFCTLLCNMLLDRIKDTFQEALQSYSSEAERDANVRGLMSQALTKATSDFDKRLSIVSVHSLTQPATSSPTVAPTPPPPSSSSSLLVPTTSAPMSSLPSDYINRLSFIYGQTRPSMFNPYVMGSKSESETTPYGDPQEKVRSESRHEVDVAMETDVKTEVSTTKVNASANVREEDVNIDVINDVIVDSISSDNIKMDVDKDVVKESAATAEACSGIPTSGSGNMKTETTLVSPSVPALPLSLTSPLQDKLASLTSPNAASSERYVSPNVQFELQKLLLSAAIAQQQQLPGLAPMLTQSKPDLSSPSQSSSSDVPVMIPSNNAFYEKREYNCNHCDATFSYGSKLRAHMICVHSIKSYQCRQCRKSFLDKDEYIQHLELHPQRKFPCDKCPSSFDKQHQLSLHYRSHTNEKPYRCQICQRQFAVNDALIRHMRIHTGERPYACNVCGKRFAQKSGLTYHSYLHTGNRPYKCPTCGQGFVHRQALKQHLMKNHLNEQVGRILNSFSPDTTTTSQSSLGWEKDALMKAEAIKRAYGWETKEQTSPGSFKLEGLASV